MEITVKNGGPLLEYLYSSLAPQSRTSIKSLLTRSRISVNGQVTTAFDYMLKPGDRIDVNSNRKATFEDRNLKIVYEDKWLIVADKRNGLPTISTGRP